MKYKSQSITVKLPARTCRVFRFYASNYNLTPECLMQSNAYNQLGSLIDDPLAKLHWLDWAA